MDESISSSERSASLRSHLISLVLVVAVVLLSLVLVVPILENIGPHPDEYQFYSNAWSLMAGKQLANFLHVAVTEYVLTGFLLFVNLLTKSGVNFPQGAPSWVTYYYGRIFGLVLSLATFAVAAFLLQKGEKRLKPRTVFFAILYFGSLGIFERFLRVNSDSMSVFVALNYILLSLWLHRKRSPTHKFLILDSVFIFLSSFTNLKALYIVLPVLGINTVLAFFNYDRDYDGKGYRLPRFYRFLVHAGALITAWILLWSYLLPRPISEPKQFWYQIKNATVWGTGSDFEYPNLAHGSWAVYIYDFFVEYLGWGEVLAILIFGVVTFRLGRRDLSNRLIDGFKNQFNWREIKTGNLYPATELILLLCFLSYYIGVAKTVIHWSRWGVPLAVLGMLIASPILEKMFFFFRERTKAIYFHQLLFFLFLFVTAWSLRVVLFVDLKHSEYPKSGGVKLAIQDVNKFLSEKGIKPEDGLKKVAWFTGYTSNVANISLEKLVDPEYKDLKYVLWPQWNIGLIYAGTNVDRTTHNQKAFVEKYAKSVSFRFPTLLSYYTFANKYFAWRYLKIPYDLEIESLIEPEYGVVELKDLPPVMSVDYTVPFKDMSHYYFPYSLTFNIKNLPESYAFPPCYSNPDVFEVTTGKYVEEIPELGPMRTAGLYCHSAWFRVALRGHYSIKVEGLPEDKDGTQRVVSTQKFKWDPATKTATLDFKDTIISVSFGVATKEKNLPNLKYIVSYDLTPK